jgi:hypothetical protein
MSRKEQQSNTNYFLSIQNKPVWKAHKYSDSFTSIFAGTCKWLVGNSIIRWTGRQFKRLNRNDFANYHVEWEGYSGMKVQQLHSKLQYGLLKSKNSNMIFLHIGGNNLASTTLGKIG